MVERSKKAPSAIHGEITCGPHGGRTNIGGKNSVLRRHFADHAREILRMDGFPSGRSAGQVIKTSAIASIVPERSVQVGAVLLDFQHRQEGGQGITHIAYQSEVQTGAASKIFRPDIDLSDGCLLRIELPIGKIGSQDQERVAIYDSVVA